MTKAKEEEIFLKALKCYQKELTNQISFHNSIGRTASIHKALIGELYRAQDLSDAIEKNNRSKSRKRAK
ncbi:MAG: hypothetical protein Tsb0034_20480 [Ekhidna sp.]